MLIPHPLGLTCSMHVLIARTQKAGHSGKGAGVRGVRGYVGYAEQHARGLQKVSAKPYFSTTTFPPLLSYHQ